MRILTGYELSRQRTDGAEISCLNARVARRMLAIANAPVGHEPGGGGAIGGHGPADAARLG